MIFKKDIKYIYFDLDNTLWDFKGNTVIALEKLYAEKADDFKKMDISFETFRTPIATIMRKRGVPMKGVN